MAKKIYEWKRFWAKREGQLNLTDGGYLFDPDSEWGKFYNPEVLSFTAIAGNPCLILLGEPGIGKSTAMKSEYSALDVSDPMQRRILDLRSVGSEDQLYRKLFESETFRNWKDGTHLLQLFLDSLDECLLRVDTIATLLVEELSNCPIDRLSLRIACRTAEWPGILEDGLLELWGKDSFATYELAPLRRRDVRDAAGNNNLDPDKFLEELDRVEAVPLAIKPITLEFLLNIYARSGEQPETRMELYSRGCLILCEEQNQSRRNTKRYGDLSLEQRITVASRIAAATIFANKYAVWTGPDLGDVPEEDISLQALIGGTECADNVSFEVTEHAIRETIATGLFTSRGAERMGWAHQTYAEYLAGKYLIDKGMTLQQIMSLIVHPSDPGRRLVPQLHETAAWLAGMDREVFHEIMKTDPEVLLRSDIAAGDDQARKNLAESLLELVEKEEILDLPWQQHRNYTKLQHPGLAEQLKPYINNKLKGRFVRRIAIDISEVCGIKELQEDLAAIALDPEEKIGIRVEAVHAVYRIGDAVIRARLIPLARGEAEDSEDRLKGWGLHAVWPNHIEAKELFSMITLPKRETYLGPYQRFLTDGIAKHLQLVDMPVALAWVEQEERRRFRSDPIERLKDKIMLKAWEFLDSPGVLDAFASVALARIKEHDQIVRDDDGTFQQQINNDDRKRRFLLEAMIYLISATNEETSYILYSTTQLALDRDLRWIIERLEAEDSSDIKLTWARYLKALFRWGGDLEQVKTILNACQTIPILAEVYEDLLRPIILDSEEAKTLKKHYRRMTEPKEKERLSLNPPPAQRVISLLDEFEKGDLSAWWRLNREMTLEPDSVYYGPDYETALLELPGWKVADERIKGRILNAARLYILQGNLEPNEWLGKAIIFRPAVAGVRALRLVTEKDPEFIADLPPEIWKKWAPAIVASPWADSADDEDKLKTLVKRAYAHAPVEILDVVTVMIDKEDREHGSISIIERVEQCWDSRLANAVLRKAKDANLKPENIGKLAEKLVVRRFHEAYEYIWSLLDRYTLEGKRSEVALFAAEALLEDARANWRLVWPVLQADEEFGRKVLEKMSYEGRRNETMISFLRERELAELFIWLSRKYPHEDDPIFDEGHRVDARESVGLWRDSILRHLKQRGTPEGCDAIEWIMEELPHLEWLKWTLLDARTITRQNTWIPPDLKDILALTKSSVVRLIQDGEQLIDIVIESLERLQTKFQAQTPSVVFLWDDIEKGKRVKPKDEGRFSDFVKIHMDEDLVQRGIIVNREVEVRRVKGRGTGERTDIQVDATKKRPDGETYDRITVVIESKGCWNTELFMAMETQLVGQYLTSDKCRHGLYLVGWFNCDLWTDDDYRKTQAPRIRINEVREKLDKQAAELSKSGKVIKAFVMDTAYPKATVNSRKSQSVHLAANGVGPS